jgi:putative membrane protein
MKNLVVRWLIAALTLLVVTKLVPGFVVDSFYAALVVAIVLGLINAVIRPVLLLITLPINLLTLGLFTFVVNALMLQLAATIVKGFEVDGFGAALIGAVVMWLIGALVERMAGDK